MNSPHEIYGWRIIALSCSGIPPNILIDASERGKILTEVQLGMQLDDLFRSKFPRLMIMDIVSAGCCSGGSESTRSVPT